jgi:hypothetical protein
MKIDPTLIPTIVNGSASATALLMTFIGLTITASYSFLKIQPTTIKQRVFWTLSLASAGLGLVGGAYVNFATNGDSQYALKAVLSGLIVVIGLSATLSNRIFRDDETGNNEYLDYA